MELKNYQQTVLDDLDSYLELLLEAKGDMPIAFSQFWKTRGVQNQSYKNNVTGVPHVCIKVPTAGGKTFIAANALYNVFRAFAEFNSARPQFVVWLVPSTTILEQTVKALSNSDHPYRRRLNTLFKGQVHIYEKDDVLQGAGFNLDTVREQLSIVVMSFDSLKGRSKDVLKAFKDNGYLASFLNDNNNDDCLLPNYDKTALINVIRKLKPVLIVDESHNAETTLSVEMLQSLNPSFILDFTATPRNNSNIISYVDAMQLKRQNMVKLPVIVANQQFQEDVIIAALKMRVQLEEYAKIEEEKGGDYIRPIVLFQAEPKNKADTTTFEKIKQHLIDLKIPVEQIKIKTASINDLNGIDLMSRDCPVRYIITINALKEGWDCPFAYILATLANKSSVVDVTQILGRVLRMPHVRRHNVDYLNLCYVFTASSQFQQTLSQVTAGLNKAGFTEKDYRVIDNLVVEDIPQSSQQVELKLNLDKEIDNKDKSNSSYNSQQEETFEVDATRLNSNWYEDALSELATDLSFTGQINNNLNTDTNGLNVFKAHALNESKAYELQAAQTPHNNCPLELQGNMNTQKMMPVYYDSAIKIALPQFFQKVALGGFFPNEEWQKFSKNELLKGFILAGLDSNIRFDDVDTEMMQFDVKEIENGNNAIEFSPLDKTQKQKLNSIIRKQSNEGQIASIVHRLFDLVGKKAFEPIADNDVKKYFTRIVEAMSQEQRNECINKDYLYIKPIKKKIDELKNEYAEKEFERWLTLDKICLQPQFSFEPNITLNENAAPISKSLYVREAKMNNFEQAVIQKIAELENVIWWHRNLEKGKGFEINGFLNHYPDFIILTKKNNLVIVETKGGDRDNSDSEAKLKLGKIWENKANLLSHNTQLRYHYMMVFQDNPIESAFELADTLDLLKQL